MPNGTSGIALIKQEDLQRLLRRLPPDAIIGSVFRGAKASEPITAGDFAKMVTQDMPENVTVLEQEYSSYVVWFDQGLVAINDDLILVPEFRRRVIRHPE